MGVSKNGGTPKSSILIYGFPVKTIHFGVPLFLETSIYWPGLFACCLYRQANTKAP